MTEGIIVPRSTGKEDHRYISGSEVAAWLKCRWYYYAAFDLGIAPKSYGRALTIGIVGHEVLAKYYRHLKFHPGDFDGAMRAANDLLLIELKKANVYQYESLTTLKIILDRYWEYSKEYDKHWVILAVEKRLEM